MTQRTLKITADAPEVKMRDMIGSLLGATVCMLDQALGMIVALILFASFSRRSVGPVHLM